MTQACKCSLVLKAYSLYTPSLSSHAVCTIGEYVLLTKGQKGTSPFLRAWLFIKKKKKEMMDDNILFSSQPTKTE